MPGEIGHHKNLFLNFIKVITWKIEQKNKPKINCP